MKPIRALSRSLARTSFANVLSFAALLLALTMSGLFTGFYFNQAWTTYEKVSAQNGIQVAALISEEMAYDETRAIEAAMANTLTNRALILDTSGEEVLGQIAPEMQARSMRLPLSHEGEPLGTLVYAPAYAFQPPIPYWIATLICIVVSIISALCMRFFARTVVSYVGQVTRLISDYSLAGTGHKTVSKFAFSEFRQLALATTRTTRRVSKELDHLRASARLDERTGLLNEPAFHQDVKETLQTLSPAAQAVLITIEVEVQNPNTDAPSLSLSNEAYVEADDRLRIFAEQAIVKHGYRQED